MLTTEECPEMSVGIGRFSDDVEMTVEYIDALTMYSGSEFQYIERKSRVNALQLTCEPMRQRPVARAISVSAAASQCLMLQRLLLLLQNLSLASGIIPAWTHSTRSFIALLSISLASTPLQIRQRR